jgi:RNA polymerase sigma-70 factor (ECF subfamily)
MAANDVLAAAQRAEPWAVQALYADLAPRVMAYFRARGAAEPEDLTSEVFLAVLPRLSTVVGGYAGLRAFVFSVAHARLVDGHRARARRPDQVPYDPDGDRRPSPSAEDEADISIGGDRAAALLQRLPASQRDVIFLRVLADLSIEETAATLGLSPGAVKQLQRRGLIGLRAAVAEQGVTR